MAKTIEANISVRFKLLQILDSFKGSIDKLAQVLDDVKALIITEEEWEQADRKKSVKQTANGPEENWTWDNEKGAKKSITLSDPSVDFVNNYIKQKDESGEVTLADKDLIDLKKLFA